MKKAMLAAISAVTAMSVALTAVPAQAQHHDRGDRWSDNRRDNRSDRRWDRREDRRDDRRAERRWQTWGGQHGYNGYRGNWRSGQRYSNWRNSRYYVNDYRAYNLPPPRRGYRYYRDSSGDIVMAAIATGVIASILSSR
jgi:Ni/Co efflux regulator RcnB